MADVRRTAFTRVIKEKLFAGAAFVNLAVSHDGFVNDKTVEIPIAGSLPDVVEDRTSYPISVTDRVDDKQSYNLIEFSLGAIRVSEKNSKELSYDQASSILNAHVKKLNNSIGLRGAYNLSAVGATQAASIIRTSGTASANTLAPSATGTRKALTLTDISLAAAKLDDEDVASTGRYLLIPAKVYWEFVEAHKAQLLNLDYNKGMTNGDIANGVVSKVYGFNIITRSYTTVFDNEATPVKKAVGAAAAATDNWACIGWQMDEVSKALGSIKIYSEKDSPVYQGDLYSGTVRFNNTPMRKDGVGTVSIVQAAG